MKKINLFLSILIFSLLLVGIYAYADEYSQKNPGHSWDEMDCDTTMCVGTNVGIGNTIPGYKLDVTGAIRSSSEIISTASTAFRMVSGNYGAFFRNDGSNTYLLFTDSGNQYGSWNSLRPLYVNNSTGNVTMNHTLSVNGALGVGGNLNMDGRTVIDDGGGWHRTYGDTGWYNGTYGGGWYMNDSNWIKAYNNKSVISGGEIRSTTAVNAVRPDCSEARVGVYACGAWRIYLSSNAYGMPYGSAASIYAPNNNITMNIGGSHALIIRDQTGGVDNANIQVHTVYATTKNFAIAHPLNSGMKLVHSAIEGPETAVYYRGEAKLKNGKAVVELPSYFEALTRKEGRTVLLTCKNDWSPVYVAGGVRNGKFMVRTKKGGNLNQTFYWEVKAVRADVKPLKTEVKSSEF